MLDGECEKHVNTIAQCLKDNVGRFDKELTLKNLMVQGRKSTRNTMKLIQQ